MIATCSHYEFPLHFNGQSLYYMTNHELLTNNILEYISQDVPVRFAADETDDPFYGKITELNIEYVIKGKVKKSTKFFYRYITLYLIIGDWKLTLCILPVKKKTRKLEGFQKWTKLDINERRYMRNRIAGILLLFLLIFINGCLENNDDETN